MKSPTPQLLPIDIGYGWTKGITPGKKPLIFPSLVSPAREIRYTGGLADGGGMTVSVNGSRYFVGALAELQGRGGAQTMNTDRVDSDEFLALFYAAASELVRVKTREVHVVTGLPVADFNKVNRRRVRAALMGEHIVARADRTTRAFEVTRVESVPQGAGSLFGMVLDRDGRVTQERKLQTGRVALIDSGQHTTNYVTFDALKYVDRLSTSDETGVSSLLLDVQRDLGDVYSINREKLSQVDADVRRGTVDVYGESVDISDLIAARVKEFGDRVMPLALSFWGNGADLAAVVLTGGGSHLLAERVRSHYPRHTRVVDDAQFSNVQGYLRLALFKRRLARR